MNKEDFVSLECAKLLKEKGYNEPCYAYYRSDNLIFHSAIFRGESVETLPQRTYSGIDAPTLYDAQKWLRENHDIDIMIYSHHKTIWFFDLWKLSDADSDFLDCSNKYNSYESALNAGIIKALKLIDKRNLIL